MFLIGRGVHYGWTQWVNGRSRQWLALFAPDVVGDFFFGLGTYHGRSGVLNAWEAWRETFPNAAFEVDEVIDAGDQTVLVALRIRGRGGISGAEIEQTVAGLYTIRPGMVVQGRAFSTKSAALEAVGLSG